MKKSLRLLTVFSTYTHSCADSSGFCCFTFPFSPLFSKNTFFVVVDVISRKKYKWESKWMNEWIRDFYWFLGETKINLRFPSNQFISKYKCFFFCVWAKIKREEKSNAGQIEINFMSFVRLYCVSFIPPFFLEATFLCVELNFISHKNQSSFLSMMSF